MKKLPRKKLVIIGDDTCGMDCLSQAHQRMHGDAHHVSLHRTCLSMNFMWARFIQEFVPTVYDHFDQTIDVDGTLLDLNVWDTSAIQEFEHNRPLVYPKTHVILLCYAVNNLRSLEQVQEKWLPEARHYCSDVPILLVGLKVDLRLEPGFGENNQDIASMEQAALVAQQINVYKHVECSAKTGEGVLELFDHAARAALEHTLIKSGKCCIVL